MPDDPYGFYGAANAEPDWRAHPSGLSPEERWGFQGDRGGERARPDPRRRAEETRSFRRDRGYGPDARAQNYGEYERDPVGPNYGRPFNDPVGYDNGGQGAGYDWSYDEGYGRGREPVARADHRGKGPKGYRRSDERIREEISDRLADDPSLDASDIELRVHNGEVTLDGSVATREDKRRAEILAERCSGVEHVQNNLRPTQRSTSGYRTTDTRGLGGLAENEVVNRVAEGKTNL